MFIGRYQHTIDPKGRVSIPARYRTALAQYEGTLLVVPQDQCLNVYPFAAWERVVGALNEQSQFDERLRRVGRLWISRAREVELDGAGRILLPSGSWGSTWTPRPCGARACGSRASATACDSRGRASRTSGARPKRTVWGGRTRSCSTSACPPTSSRRRDAASPSSGTNHSTC